MEYWDIYDKDGNFTGRKKVNTKNGIKMNII